MSGGYALYLTGGRPAFGLSCDGGDFTPVGNAVSQLPADAWSHLAVTFESGVVTLYANGVEVDEGTVCERPFALPAEPFQIAYDDPAGGDPMEGMIDEVRLSSAARYSGTFTPPLRHEPDGNTLALFHFDETDPRADDSPEANQLNLPASVDPGTACRP